MPEPFKPSGLDSSSPEYLSLMAQYPGVFLLDTLPEVKSLYPRIIDPSRLEVTLASNDGFTLQSQLRQPLDSDFKGNMPTVAGQLILDPDVTISDGRNSMNLVASCCEQFGLSKKDLTIAINASSSHLQRFPSSITGSMYNPDALTIVDITRSLLEVKPSDSLSTLADFKSNSVQLQLFPTGTLSMVALIHELAELAIKQQELTDPIAAEYFAQAKAQYELAARILFKNNIITEKISWLNVVKKMEEEVTKKTMNTEVAEASMAYLLPYKRYQIAQKKAKLLSERQANDMTSQFMHHILSDFSLSSSQQKGVRTLVNFMNHSYGKSIEYWMKSAAVIASGIPVLQQDLQQLQRLIYQQEGFDSPTNRALEQTYVQARANVCDSVS